MNKPAVIIITTILLVTGNCTQPVRAQSQNPNILRPGSPLNPITIQPVPGTENHQIKPQFPSLNQNPMRAGGQFNPYVISPRPGGGYNINSKYNWSVEEGE